MRRLIVLLSVFGLFLAACAGPGSAIVVATQSSGTPSPTGEPTHIPVDIPPAARAAIDALMAQLGLGADAITLVSVESVQWPDRCLGVLHKGVLCAQGVVQGFRVILKANDTRYEFHTNEDGSLVVLATPDLGEPTEVPVDIPAAARAAITVLMGQLNLAAGQIGVISVEAVDWPDGCLGVTRIGVLCTQAIVPGFRVVLEANGKQYEFHTNQDGSVVLPVDVAVEIPDSMIKAATDALAQALGIANVSIKLVSATLIQWADSCLGVSLPGSACAQHVTPGYLIVLEANGVQYEYHTNQDGSLIIPGSLALVWRRIGGIAGFCDTLVLYRSGEAQAEFCKPNTGGADASQATLLTADEQDHLAGWLQQFGTVSIDQESPANASDQMSVTLTLYGAGSAQPTEAEQQAMLDFAQTVYARLHS